MSEIPMDILFGEILSLLPAQDLLRYRCVCMLWRDTVDQPSFIQTHLDRQIKSSSDGGFTQLILRGEQFNRFYSLSLQCDDESNIVEAKYLNHNFSKNCVVSYALCSSCRGIMLVKDGYSNKYLWNPFTRQHRKLPPIRVPIGSVHQVVMGLGYDSSSHDYKVVHIDQFEDDNDGSFRSKTYVYSLKKNTWRKIKNFPWQTFQSMNGVFLNGALHYIANPHADFIVALDLGTEDYRVFPLPFAPNEIMYFGVLNGCLVLTCRDHPGPVNVWLMKDDRVENSWVKLFSFGDASIGVLRPLSYFKDKDREQQILIQRGHDELHWLDLQTHSMTRVRICDRPMIPSYQTCVESLVRLDSDVRGMKRPRRQMISNSK